MFGIQNPSLMYFLFYGNVFYLTNFIKNKLYCSFPIMTEPECMQSKIVRVCLDNVKCMCAQCITTAFTEFSLKKTKLPSLNLDRQVCFMGKTFFFFFFKDSWGKHVIMYNKGINIIVVCFDFFDIFLFPVLV